MTSQVLAPPVYSDLCDADLSAYRAYVKLYEEYTVLCNAFFKTCNGSSAIRSDGKRERGGDGESCSGCRDSRDSVVGDDVNDDGGKKEHGVVVLPGHGLGGDGVGSCGVESCGQDSSLLVGSSGVCLGGAVHSVADFVGYAMGGTDGDKTGTVNIESKTQRNRRWRRERKEKKGKRKQMSMDWRRRDKVCRGSIVHLSEPKVEASQVGECDELKESVKRKWIAKNKLEQLEAERRISVLQSNDIDAEVKRYRTRVSVQTERNMVAMEKAHATLVVTGNVPHDQMRVEDAGSRVCTLVTDKSGSISPDSSASQAEFRAVQKKNLDLEAQILEMKQMFKQTGVSYEALKKADQMTFTDNTENGIIMDELYPKGIGCHFVERNGVSKLRIGCEDY